MNHVTQSGKRLHCKRSGTSPSLSSVNHGKSASCRRKSGVGCQVAASNDCGSLGRACGKNHSNIDHWQYEFFIYIYHYIGLHFDIVSEFITYIYIHAHYIYTHHIFVCVFLQYTKKNAIQQLSSMSPWCRRRKVVLPFPRLR